MYSAHARYRVTTGIAGLLIAGSGLLAATSAYAAAQPRPAVPADSAASAAAPASAGQQTQATAEPRGRVVSRLPLTIREKATSASRSLGTFQPGTVIWLHCKVVGQNVDGNKLWYRLGNGRPGYVAARYVQNLSAVPYCA
jgi:hypothetical protein